MILDHIRARFLGGDLYARATYTRVYTVNWILSMYGANDASCKSDGTTSYPMTKSCIAPACSTSRTLFASEDWVSLATSPDFDAMYQQTRSYKSAPRQGKVSGLWPNINHLDPPDLPRHGCNSDRGPAASGGPTVLANDSNDRRLQLNAPRHDENKASGQYSE